MKIQDEYKSKEDVLKEVTDAYDPKFFKTLSEPVRMKILQILMIKGRSDIQSIAENMTQDRSVISRHLNYMFEAGILLCEKETRHMYYQINGRTFIDKLETFLNRIKDSVAICCPIDCCEK